jgi:glycosyltransferase involved in cell wall biosynthesis
LCYRSKTIGVVVPAFNEELLIVDTLRSIPGFVDKAYVVDDCSKDRTKDLVKDFAKQDSRIICISHEKNRGVGGAIITGYKDAIKDGIDIVVVMAGDNQMDPKYLTDLLNPIVEEAADFTKGNRLKPGFWKGMSAWRLFGNYLLNILNKIASGYWDIDDPQNGYVAISFMALLRLDLDKLYNGYAFENDIMIKANLKGIRMKSVRIPAKYGNEKSKIKYKKFIAKTSLFLFFSFLWRVWNKYLTKGHPIGFFYAIGCCGIIIGLILLLMDSWLILVYGLVFFVLACIWEARAGQTVLHSL